MTDSRVEAAWEYLVIPEAERNRLAALGLDGWQLVGVGGSADDRILYLKRRGPDFRERVTLEQRNGYDTSRGLDRRNQRKRGLE